MLQADVNARLRERPYEEGLDGNICECGFDRLPDDEGMVAAAGTLHLREPISAPPLAPVISGVMDLCQSTTVVSHTTLHAIDVYYNQTNHDCSWKWLVFHVIDEL